MGNGVGAIIKDTVKNKYIFVSQYRAGAEGLMVEIVAGKIDEGEKPEEAIKYIVSCGVIVPDREPS